MASGDLAGLVLIALLFAWVWDARKPPDDEGGF
jgi:hypothetical protein